MEIPLINLLMTLCSFILISISSILALAAMAFFTLIERKVLGYIQTRKGPNKVSILGIPQPLADAIKLFLKELPAPAFSNLPPFIISPILRLTLALFIWVLIPLTRQSYFISLSLLLFLIFSRIRVYTVLFAGWTSNSKFRLIGAIRNVAQTISYEVSIAIILISILFITSYFNFFLIFSSTSSIFILMGPPIIFIWFTTSLAETNRTPFDLAEGERELVSGFNTEYARGPFALIFISEYLNILIISALTRIFIASSFIPALINVLFISKILFVSFFFLWIRATMPRIRYDKLINLTWKSFLPISLTLLPLILILSSYAMTLFNKP